MWDAASKTPVDVYLRSNWSEITLAMVAVLKGQGDAARAFIVGSIAMSSLLVTGGCLLDQSKQSPSIKYPLLMALLHSRLIIGGIAFLLLPVVLSRSFSSESTAFCVGSRGIAC